MLVYNTVVYILVYMHIWEVVALCETQTNYDYGGDSVTSGDKVLHF